MASVALRLDGVSKLYRLGQVGTGTLSHDLNRLLARMLGRPDPYAKIGGVNNRRETGGDYVWALRDVSFEVPQGEILGVIGSNGAGKSTLLKLLSRVTGPTEGTIRTNGRMASLLEVGTGFHPELSGRENIYLNGAILGMTRREITASFDEIVEFSGCAKYIDTPVKRYSTGMYVRLAFAVAAHLETDILIVDEVLAVGDAEFQQKCLGKMRDMSRSGGRTVLFVSHNMTSIRGLCDRSLLFDEGRIVAQGKTSEVIEEYMTISYSQRGGSVLELEGCGSDEIELTRFANGSLSRPNGGIISTEDDINIDIEYRILRSIKNLRLIVKLTSNEGVEILHSSDFLFWPAGLERKPGRYLSRCVIPGNLLNKGAYHIAIVFDVPSSRVILKPSATLSFSIQEFAYDQTGITYDGSGNISAPAGIIHPKLKWAVERIPS